jgi:uncharacterized protein involved in cysteine biosynthesis
MDFLVLLVLLQVISITNINRKMSVSRTISIYMILNLLCSFCVFIPLVNVIVLSACCALRVNFFCDSFISV